MTARAVDVLGVGAVTGYGWGMDPLWAGLLSGRTSARPHTGLGGRFPDPCWIARVPEHAAPEPAGTRYTRAVTAAADEAIVDALARGWRPGERVAVVHATTGADRERLRARYLAWGEGSARRMFVEQTWTTSGSEVMRRHGYHGPFVIVSTACSSGLHALAVAHRLLLMGDATDAVVVSADIGADGEEIRLFSELGALVYDKSPDDVCRPLQSGTSGFVMGEGAGALVLSRSARSSKEAYARLLGTAMSNDAYHPTSIEPSFTHVLRALDASLRMADVSPGDAGYYAAHATGTRECDNTDRAALAHLGDQAVAFGFKPLLGHTMGTAPMLEAVITANAYREGFLPAVTPLTQPHAQLAPRPGPHKGGVTAQLALGFGGNIATAVWAEAQNRPHGVPMERRDKGQGTSVTTAHGPMPDPVKLHKENVRMLGEQDVVVAAYPGSGNALLGNILMELGFAHLDPYTERVAESGDAQVITETVDYRRRLSAVDAHDRRTNSVRPKAGELRFCKNHLPPQDFTDVPLAGAVLLVRDPRDAIHSSYHWFRSFVSMWLPGSDKGKGAFEEFLDGLGINDEPPIQGWVDLYRSWHDALPGLRRSAVVRFEDLKADPTAVTLRLLSAFGLTRSPEAVARAVERSDYVRMRAHEDRVAAQGVQDRGSAGCPPRIMRRGKVGEWREWYGDETLAARFRHPELVTVASRFGYQLADASG
ncbi:sulfotransferase domain-containing protein [Streptomyces sp. NA02950]|uniref:beta-ketoacyl synthase N-terminal-like domain-containing protein n=1 Tax=Streptomyces sp. NA02950 TaxID=2742137 RepID=UPI0015908922|nr:beta-ketoacyl synthase N-terminal-like domain-containing protein [Streptomyces sp. NA02950]QKV97189.1 sulfotransferase domain-containing protein [Streptomyces sp. NA02950]